MSAFTFAATPASHPNPSQAHPAPWSTRAEWAKYWAGLGVALTIIPPGAKVPNLPDWPNRPIDPSHWARHPEDGMGALLGRSGLCSLDADDTEGTAIALAAIGLNVEELRAGAVIIQGNPARWRAMFKLPAGQALSRKALAWPDPSGELDAKGKPKMRTVFELRAGACQDVLPPSVHPGTGKPYALLVAPWHLPEWAELPAPLLSLWQDWDRQRPALEAACPWAPPKPEPKPDPKPPEPPPAKPAPAAGGESVIAAFNAAHDAAAILESHGYTPTGPDRWLSPHSSTGEPGIHRLSETGRIYCHHGSDPLSGPPHDAFSLITVLQHGGDHRAAVKAAAKLLGIPLPPREDATQAGATQGQAEEGRAGAPPLTPAEVDRLLSWAAHTGATLPDAEAVGIFQGPPDRRTGKPTDWLRVTVRTGTDFSAPWRKLLWTHGQAGFMEAVSGYLPKRAALVERKNAERLAKGETPQGDLSAEDLRTHAERWLANILAMEVGEEEGRALLARLPSEWPEPQPIAASVEAAPYPLYDLPDPILAAVVEARAFTQAPLPLVASAALAALSLAGQHLANVRRGPKLEGPCSLYLLTVNDSGERKSTVEGLFMAPIREWEKEQARALAPEVERHKGELAAWQAEKNGITERLKSLARAGKPTEEARRDLIANAAEMPLPPRLPRLLYQDITSEALAWCLSSGWPCGGIVSAEAGTVFGGHAMGKDSITRALGLLNLLWDASAPVNVDRRTSESFTVRAARVSLSLMIQEPTLLEFLDRAGALARGSGFLARFLLAWPASTQGTRFYQAPPEGTPALSAFTDRLGALLRYPLPLDEDERLSPPVLPLSPSAHRAWAEFHDAIEVELKDGGELRLVRDVASKTADNAARLACLFHLFAHGPSGEITQDHFSRAASIVAWHLSESRRFFGEVAMPVDLADAARLDRWLLDYARREQAASLPTREAQRLGPVRHKTRLADALVALEELGRARVTQEGRQKLIVLNPALVAEVAP